eukprot:TRINITY_DN13504_c0_g1_i2.p1 TRINITY_DN13504_c0_g1~~TRINITY_DN13504_c0_g1_i2.p1  ORF type:complete len:324 (+),score=94.98 TRINITY_DN13504_c0_g1_i2:168-1139(+)
MSSVGVVFGWVREDPWMFAWGLGWTIAILVILLKQRWQQQPSQDAVYRRMQVRCPDEAGRAAVEQYMHELGARAVSMPQGDEAVVEVLFSGDKARELMARAADLAADPASSEGGWRERALVEMHRSWRTQAMAPESLWVSVPGTSLVMVGPFMGVFGLNDHQSSVLCSRWVASVCAGAPAETKLLDYGSGTGLLCCIAAQALQAGAVIHGVDIDPKAVRCAKANAAMNGLGNRMQFFHNDEEPAEHRAGAGYHVLVANILPGPLIELEPAFAVRVRPGGQVGFCGVQEKEAEQVLAAYKNNFEIKVAATAQGFVLLTGIRRLS